MTTFLHLFHPSLSRPAGMGVTEKLIDVSATILPHGHITLYKYFHPVYLFHLQAHAFAKLHIDFTYVCIGYCQRFVSPAILLDGV